MQYNRLLLSVIVTLTLTLSAFVSTAIADSTSRSGSFRGLSNHDTSGSVTVVQTEAGHVIELGEDFSFDGAPDPKIALGKDGKYDPGTLIRLLKSNSGAQSYVVPESIDVSDYNEVYIWCEKYSVGLGVASLK
ncbi:DM13 domain-containing protein [Granulosicoccus sp. 3-233]|uniref:DM13 domain-containing protein n=1 Tax=Granulosicoccus sp. 3-233 TaxID=3417969 RepID=UPI003D32F15E